MFGFFKKKERGPAYGSYRIAPYGTNQFAVERFEYDKFLDDIRPPYWQVVDTRGLPFSDGGQLMVFDTEREAEKWVYDKFKKAEEDRLEKLNYDERKKAHAAKYPAREIPPYKYDHRR